MVEEAIQDLSTEVADTKNAIKGFATEAAALDFTKKSDMATLKIKIDRLCQDVLHVPLEFFKGR